MNTTVCVNANGLNLIHNNDLHYSHHIFVVSQTSILSAFLLLTDGLAVKLLPQLSPLSCWVLGTGSQGLTL